MALTPGPCGEASGANAVTTTEVNILDFSDVPHRNGATALKIVSEAGNTVNLKVRIPTMHGPTSFALIFPGETEIFRLGDSEMRTCYVSTVSLTADIRWHTVATT